MEEDQEEVEEVDASRIEFDGRKGEEGYKCGEGRGGGGEWMRACNCVGHGNV